MFRYFILATGLLFSTISFAQVKKPKEEKLVPDSAYFHRNHSYPEFADDGLFSGFHLLDSAARVNSIFIMGEFPGVGFNPVQQFEFFRYFYYRAKVRYLVIDRSYSYAYLLNHFLKTADSSLIHFFQDRRNFYEYQNFYHSLFHFNLNLPPSQRIQVVGIDSEHYLLEMIYALFYILDQKGNKPYNIEKIRDKLYGFIDNSLDHLPSVRILIDEIRKDVKQYDDKYRKWLGEAEYAHFRYILDYKNITLPATDLEKYQNFSRQDSLLTAGNFFVQVQYQNADLSQTKFAGLLNTSVNKPYAGKVLVIAPYYENCMSIFLEKPLFGQGFRLSKEELTFLKQYAIEPVTLFRFDRPDFPFPKTKARAQYLLFLQDQKPLTRHIYKVPHRNHPSHH